MESECRVSARGTKRYFKPGTKILHRVDGPAVEWENGDKQWRQNGKLHRVDGPALTWPDGSEQWRQNGRLHRVDGPAVVWGATGLKEWYQNNKRHREDGPAIEWGDGNKGWWIEGKELTPTQFKLWQTEARLNEFLALGTYEHVAFLVGLGEISLNSEELDLPDILPPPAESTIN